MSLHLHFTHSVRGKLVSHVQQPVNAVLNGYKVLIRLLVSSTAAAIVIPILYTLWGLTQGGSLSGGIFVFVVALVICLLHLLLLGFPCLYYLNKTGRLNKTTSTWVGFGVGYIPSFVATFQSQPEGILGAFLSGAFGAISARVFWLTWEHMGPQTRSEPP